MVIRKGLGNTASCWWPDKDLGAVLL